MSNHITISDNKTIINEKINDKIRFNYKSLSNGKTVFNDKLNFIENLLEL